MTSSLSMPPSHRSDFLRVTSSRVLQPATLPPAYRWMAVEHYCVYKGVDQAGRPANWAWEIERVMGSDNDQELFGLVYGLYMQSGTEWFGDVSWGTLFHRYFQTIGDYSRSSVDTPAGSLDCYTLTDANKDLKTRRSYHWCTSALIHLSVEASRNGVRLSDAILSETNIKFSGNRTDWN